MNRSVITSLFILSFSCGLKSDKHFQFDLPPKFSPPEIPFENPMEWKKIELGKLLFYDPILSDDSTISCSTCHIPERAFTDGKSLPVGIKGHTGVRNSPTLVNVAYYPYFFVEGKVKDLETQALAPGLHADEMGTEMKKMIYRLRKNKFYSRKFKQVFGEEADVKHVVYALACYERTLIAGNSKYDRYMGTNDSTIFSQEEWEGYNLFFSERTNCSKCHNGNLFTDFSFQNIGLYEYYMDPGLNRATVLKTDSGKFKTPTLRNIEYTGPYMHDGSVKSLEEIVELYNDGGKNHPNKSEWIKPLGLNEEEKHSLISFLKCLTDEDLKKKQGIFKTPELSFSE